MKLGDCDETLVTEGFEDNDVFLIGFLTAYGNVSLGA